MDPVYEVEQSRELTTVEQDNTVKVAELMSSLWDRLRVPKWIKEIVTVESVDRESGTTTVVVDQLINRETG